MPLFRPEALRSQDTLHGEVRLTPPVSWQLLGVFLLGSTVVAGAFLALAGYARVTVARGAVAVDRGVVRLAPSRSGVFDRVLVREGQAVRAGDLLAHVSLDATEAGGSLQARRTEALARQAGALDERLSGLDRGARERIGQLQAQIAGDAVQARGFQDQIAIQEPLLRAAEDDLREVEPLRAQGLLNNKDYRDREEQVAARRQALSRLRQEVEARRTSTAVARAEIARTGAEQAAQAGQIRAARAELDRSAAGDDTLRGVDLRAPVAGVVTAILAHPGELAAPGVTAMTLVPRDSRTEAVLTVPASAIGLVDPGQPVRVAVDAYPFQTFGALEGKVVSVSRAASPGVGASEVGRDAFLVRTTLPPAITAYGQARPLAPGMTVSARIRTRPRSLLAWMFDPVLAVARR